MDKEKNAKASLLTALEEQIAIKAARHAAEREMEIKQDRVFLESINHEYVDHRRRSCLPVACSCCRGWPTSLTGERCRGDARRVHADRKKKHASHGTNSAQFQKSWKRQADLRALSDKLDRRLLS